MAKNDFGEELDPYGDPQAEKESSGPYSPVAGTQPLDGGGYDYKKFLDAWYNAPSGTNLDKFITDNPSFTKGATTSKGGEILNLPGGESFDAVQDFGPGGLNHPIWGSQNYDYETGAAYTPAQANAAEALWAQQHGVAQTSFPGGGGPSASASPTSGASTPIDLTPYDVPEASPGFMAPASEESPNPSSGFMNTWRRASTENPQVSLGLLAPSEESAPVAGPTSATSINDAVAQLLAKGNKPVTSEDLASQFNPVSASFQRSAQRAKQAAAERSAYQGQNIGGAGGSLDAEMASIDEDVANSEGQLMAQLTTQEIQARRQDVVNALNFAQGEESIQLQRQLADIDRQLRSRGLDLTAQQISNQNTQFGQSLGLQKTQVGNQNTQFYKNLDLQKLLAEVDRQLRQQGIDLSRTQIGNQNSQFYDDFGLRLAHENNSSNDELANYLTA